MKLEIELNKTEEILLHDILTLDIDIPTLVERHNLGSVKEVRDLMWKIQNILTEQGD